jgi:superfamily II DNA or RNA helicase
MPCGTGKTLTSLWIREQLNSRRTLLLFPTLELLRQTVQVWHAEASQPFEVMRVCGDPPSPDDEIAAADLSPSEAGAPITTDPKEIAAFLERPGRQAVFATYHSSPQVARALALVDEPLDLVICDEAHYCAGLESGPRKTVLHDEKVPADRRLFVTATPTMFSPAAKDKALSVRAKVASMDDRKLFGPVLHRLSFKSAVAQGLLCPYRVWIMPVTDEEVADMVERRHHVSPDHGEHVTDAHTLAAQIACLRVMQEHDCRRLVAFHPRVDPSRRFAEELELAAQLMREDERPAAFSAAHIDGYMTRPQRELLLRGFAGDDDRARVLSNVRLLAEGVDVPRIDAICLVETNRRPSAVVQAVGRVVRTAPGKEHGIVLVPVLRRDGESLEQALRRSEHRGVLEVLAALLSIDTEIRNTVDAVRIELGPRGPATAGSGSWVLDVATEVDDEFARAVEVCLVDVLGAETSTPAKPRDSSDVRGVLWDLSAGAGPARPDWTRAEAFEEAIAAAKRWRDENGYQPLERFDLSGDFPLGDWWTLLLRLLEQGVHVDGELLVRCAEPLNYAAISIIDHPGARVRLARAAPSDLAARVDAWLENPYDFCQDGSLRAHASGRRIGPYGVVRAADLVEHIPDRTPGDRRLAMTEMALNRAGDALHRANQEPSAACQGLMDSITAPDDPHDLQDEPPAPGKVPVGVIQCYLCAWEAGQEVVRLLRGEHSIDPDHFDWPDWFTRGRD